MTEKLKVWVTGAGGFMGSHLLDFLLEKGCEVYGTYHSPTTDVSKLNPKATIEQVDVRDEKKVRGMVEKIRPDRIYHLAAQSFPAVSWEKPAYTIEANMIGTINIFEALKELKLTDTKVLIACSSAEYGFVTPDEVPVKESHSLLPLHPYGVSKVGQDLLGYQYYQNFKLWNVRVRIFNTTGPRKAGDVCSDFTKQIVMIEKGKQEPVMKVGNLDVQRAITDVRDIINAFWSAIEDADPDVYNLSGAKAYKIGDLLEMLKKMTDAKFEVKQDPALMRPTDEPIIMGDSTKFINKTGWKQSVLIEKTLKDMLDYWREVL
jgi:GDP-mannose 4,6-dehydratase